MIDNHHLTPVPSGEAWTPHVERSYEQGEISPNQARERSGLSIPEHMPDPSGALPGHINSIGHEATASAAGLELVTEDHVSAPGARREAKLKKSRTARSWREKLAADQPPEHQRVVPLGHDSYIAVSAGAGKNHH
jgi:hypothetical protein